MKPSSTFAFGALLSVVVAQPLMEKRDATVTDWKVVTVDVYTTVTGDAPAITSAANPKHADHLAYHAQNKAESQAQPASPSSSSSSSSSSPPAQQPAADNSPVPVQQKAVVNTAPVSPTGSSPDASQSSVNAAQEAVNQKQVDANNAHQSSMIALQNGDQAPTSQPPVQQAPPSSAPAAPAQSSAPTAPAQSSAPVTPPSSSGGSCGSIGGSCSGDVTIYNDQGLGACGWANDTNSDDFFALAAPMFGTYTNDAPGPHKNAFCGRMASIQVNGKSFTGMLTDRCGGCVGQSIDLSQHLFSQLYPNEPPGNGRYHDVQWQFTSGPTFSQG